MLEKLQACRDLNLDLCGTGVVLFGSWWLNWFRIEVTKYQRCQPPGDSLFFTTLPPPRKFNEPRPSSPPPTNVEMTKDII